MKQCPECKHTTSFEDKKFCYRDGRELVPVSYSCSGCGVDLGVIDRFCEYCGTRNEAVA